MTPNTVDGQWLDFYALLDVPVNADEDIIRKRIGKVYAEAAANSDHRDLTKRHYFQALVERVLPQCRRVLLDPEWRAKYDRQHILHSIGDPSAQDYVTFIGSVRGGVAKTEENKIPSRIQEEIKLAQQVVETVQSGEQMDLIPAKAISVKPDTKVEEPAPQPVAVPDTLQVKRNEVPAKAGQIPVPAEEQLSSDSTYGTAFAPTPKVEKSAPGGAKGTIDAAQLEKELEGSEDTAVRAKVITAQEAADIRRRRASNVDAHEPIIGKSLHKPDDGTGILVATKHKKSGPVSRVTVGDEGSRHGKAKPRLISTTSLNLMVAITGVLLTITIQKMALVQPAQAGNSARMPVFVTVSSSLEPALEQAETSWEQTPEGSGFDVVLQPLDSQSGLRRALGRDGKVPDAWVPSDSLWRNRYNDLAAQNRRHFISAGSSLVTTPLVLIARSDRAGFLKQRFPNHVISSWNALRSAVVTGADGHFGITDPGKSGAGAIARYSMADEWSRGQGLPLRKALHSPQLWQWMAGFEDNSPAKPELTSSMVKDLVLGTTGNYWWGLAYESDALGWMNKGKSLEIFYLPRTIYADHPFCDLERVGATGDSVQARSNFEKFLRSDSAQKAFLKAGFRPTEIEITTKVDGNPFLSADFRKRGARVQDLPRPERVDFDGVDAVAAEWAQRYGG